MSDPAWFVYLFALSDCSAFKVGFSCNPFQRINTFSRRYYERFDVTQSLLLRLGSEADARAIEATLKRELAAYRTDSPVWVPLEAGGQTEWFSAVELGRAGERLRSFLAEHEVAGDKRGRVFSQRARTHEQLVRALGLEPGAAGLRCGGVCLHAKLGASARRLAARLARRLSLLRCAAVQ